jgi:hypothetical protein
LTIGCSHAASTCKTSKPGRESSIADQARQHKALSGSNRRDQKHLQQRRPHTRNRGRDMGGGRDPEIQARRRRRHCCSWPCALAAIHPCVQGADARRGHDYRPQRPQPIAPPIRLTSCKAKPMLARAAAWIIGAGIGIEVAHPERNHQTLQQPGTPQPREDPRPLPVCSSGWINA